MVLVPVLGTLVSCMCRGNGGGRDIVVSGRHWRTVPSACPISCSPHWDVGTVAVSTFLWSVSIMPLSGLLVLGPAMAGA